MYADRLDYLWELILFVIHWIVSIALVIYLATLLHLNYGPSIHRLQCKPDKKETWGKWIGIKPHTAVISVFYSFAFWCCLVSSLDFWIVTSLYEFWIMLALIFCYSVEGMILLYLISYIIHACWSMPDWDIFNLKGFWCFAHSQGDADSGLDRLWQKKKAEVKQQ